MVGFPDKEKLLLKVGDKVKITDTGLVMETYPAQIDEMKIELIEQ